LYVDNLDLKTKKSQLQTSIQLATQQLSHLVAQIVPHDSPLIVKALVEAEDIRKVEKGQDVQIRVSGCSYADYGTLPGKVMDISPDAVSGSVPQAFTPQSSDYKGTYYQVTIQPERLELNGGIHKCAVQAGMGARADILSSEETVLHLFLRKARLLTDL
jgi:multidrug efflux pump subunit AcrA (membrane-fusion protein)